MGNMEFQGIILYLLLFLKDYSLGDNVETLTIKSNQRPDLILNQLIPQHVYTIPNVPNIRRTNPVLNLRLGSELNNVPKIIVTQQKSPTITTTTSIPQPSAPIQPKKLDSETVPNQNTPKEEKAKDKIQEIKNDKAKTNSTYPIKVVAKDELKIDRPQKNETKIVVKQHVVTQTKDATNDTKSKPTTGNQKPSKQEKPKSKPPHSNKDEKPEPPKEILEIPSNKKESIEKDSQKKNFVGENKECTSEKTSTVDNNQDKPSAVKNEDSPAIAIYKLGDEYLNPPNRDRETITYTFENKYLNNPPPSMSVIKNQTIEEFCERTHPNYYPPRNPFEQYIFSFNFYEPYPYPDSYIQNNFLPSNYEILPYYPYQNIEPRTPMENIKDRVKRIWRNTEIYTSQNDPSKNCFNNVYSDGNNGFITPFINGYDYGNQNVPLPYQYYSCPTYKNTYVLGTDND